MSDITKPKQSRAAGDFYRANKRRAKVGIKLFHDRVASGTPWEEALTRESRKGKTLREFYRAHKDIATVSYTVAKRAVARGVSYEDAIKGVKPKVSYTLTECKEYLEKNRHKSSIRLKTFYERVNSGHFTLKAALLQPVANPETSKKKFYIDNKDRAQVGYSGFLQRIEKGATWEEALTAPSKFQK